MRYLIRFSYDGSLFYGYQVQPNLRTVQGELERAVSYLNRQTFHFDLSIPIPVDKIRLGLNTLLPDDIHVFEVIEVDDSFHARYMVKSKKYVYRINMGEYNPMMRNYVYQLGRKLDISIMQEASQVLVGVHDFRSFVDSEDKRENTVREIYKIDFLRKDEELFITFIGNGFMKYQVRSMVGALIEIGLGRKTKEELQILLESKSRKRAPKGAPANGLYLEQVYYDSSL